MKIALYLMSGVYVFRLPNQVLGSFSFDSDDNVDKLINIDAKDGKWVLYSTSDVSVINNNVPVKEVTLENNRFYTLKRNGKYFLIYVSSLTDTKMNMYQISEKSKLIIGNNNNCNIKYNCPYINNLILGITFANNKINIQREGNTAYYVNKNAIVDKIKSFDYGIEIDLYGLRIKILKDIMIISKLDNLIISNNLANISNLQILSVASPQDIPIKDIDLYKKEDYASKAPRIRRLIEDKKIKIANPPSLGKKEELPLLLVIGPMLTMGIISFSMLANNLSKIFAGKTTFADCWSQLLMSGAMLLSTILWPTLTKKYQKKIQKQKEEEINTKYNNYLLKKGNELESESILEKAIITENLITIDKCIENIKRKNINFWSKRIDQNDFLLARIGIGNEKLKAEIDFSTDELSIEENPLKDKAENLINNYKYIQNVPVGYSFYENIITAIMGNRKQTIDFVNNIILQFISFYSYEDLKIVVFTNEKNSYEWEYIKYLNHNFTNDKSLRLFGSDYESRKRVSDYLGIEVSIRKENNLDINKPHYLIIVDDYEKIKRYGFINNILDDEKKLGFSFIIVENLLSKLPSKCDNFITINDSESGILKNSYENQEKLTFKHEIVEGINMFDLVKYVSNVPIEFEKSVSQLPNSINFLEMEQVGKIEQLNILNRWNINDSSISLKTEIGVDEQGDLMYLDLHEKFHGPHGLIAGTTGSGKSEFIITYILSLSMNYSPDDVSFILIDYKGGGLAFAFENKLTGVTLPHLAGTITNLDKAEMDRTLVSIDSEVKRRQKMFNSARDVLGESTIDIYKYQKYYKEGKIKDPIPHLFIICDEFAELKSQQPEFMDNLISVARIGRSLGVHLILATQKPTGVVNDQIWSNSRFKVCLKVQDESDSKEMIKRKDAAYIKQAGRFFLQVGYDEFFALGQSAWCGAKYYPSDKIVTEVDKSINFIDSCGSYIKSIQAGSGIKVKPEGEQLSNVLNEIILVSNKTNKKSKKLWLDNIPDIIINDDLEKKYNYKPEPYHVKSLIGEYDAPEKQEQGNVIYDFLEEGNTLIYGNDGSEREMLLETIIYSSVKNYSVDELNYYIIDYGSESFRKYNSLAHIGGIVYVGEEEKYNNLIKLIRKNINDRKKLFANYGGEYSNYIKSSGKKLPLKVIIVNNYDSIYESNPDAYDIFSEITRDSERYGIVFIFTGNAVNSIQLKLAQNFHNIYAFKLKDKSDYSNLFGMRCNVTLRDYKGRGIIKQDQLHEFQVSSLIENEDNINDFITNFITTINSKNSNKAEKIPVLPKYIRFDDIKESIKGLKFVPIGLNKVTLDPVGIDLESNLGVIITSNKIEYTYNLVTNLCLLFNNYKNMYLSVIDCSNSIKINNLTNYYNNDFDKVIDNITNYIQSLIDSNSTMQGVIIVNGISKLVNKITDATKLQNLINIINKYEKISVIVSDDAVKLKKLSFEAWFINLFNVNYGIWIGKGISTQSLLHISNVTRDMTKEYKNDMGYTVSESYPTLIKFIDFISKEDDKNE